MLFQCRFASLLVFVCSLLFAAVAQAAPSRLALVLGNSEYEFGQLKNPANDAALIAESLRETGFDVYEHLEADQREMKRAIVNFGRALGEAGEDAVGLVYYAGHGVQFGGENYMIPVGAQIEDELDIDIEGIRASTLLASLERAGNRLNIVILDACRNNPFGASSRSATQGLARMDAPSGTLLAYSTSPGNVAVDGSGRNSPYTQALARAIREPGTKVEDVFKRVRIAVMERTNEKQVPWEASSLTGDFYFTERLAETPTAATTAPIAIEVPGPSDQAVEIEYWKAIANSDDPEMFRGYMAQFPDGIFTSIAAQRITALEQDQAARSLARQRDIEQQLWNEVKDSDDPALFESFLAQYPDSIFGGLARARIASLQNRSQTQTPGSGDQIELVFWQSIQNSADPADYQAYLAQYPDGQFAAIARNRAEEAARSAQSSSKSSTKSDTTKSAKGTPPAGEQTALAPGVTKFVGVVETVDGLGNLGPTWCRGEKQFPIEIFVEAGGLSGEITLEQGQKISLRGQVTAGRMIGKAITNRGFDMRGRVEGTEMTGKIYNPFGSHSCGGKFRVDAVQAQ